MSKKMLIGSIASKTALVLMSLAILWFGFSMLPEEARATDNVVVEESATVDNTQGMKYIAAAISVGLGSIAGGIAVAVVGSAALGAAAERPEIMGRSLIFVGLAEGIAIYGTAIAAVILLT
jgi:V/A-type H+-transporting ATPase subunit K